MSEVIDLSDINFEDVDVDEFNGDDPIFENDVVREIMNDYNDVDAESVDLGGILNDGDGDEGFEERMALAIQMSLTIDDRSVVHMTDDIPHEYGLGMWEMFN